MKTVVVIAAALSVLHARAEIITQWDFNSVELDFDPQTGRFEPNIGAGSAQAIGTVTWSFGTVASGATSDPMTEDNSQVRLRSFPAQGTGNKTSGLEFRADTRGFESIELRWDHYNSATASRFWRIQYTLDGLEWTDHEVYVNSTASSWRRDRSVSFKDVRGANDNPNFGLRIAAEFEQSATGAGADEYLAVSASSSYSSAGTFWIDMVTLHGEGILAGNRAPFISSIPDQVTLANTPVGPLAFTVDDVETPPLDLVVDYAVSDPNLIAELTLGGSGGERSIRITPATDVVGTIVITLRVTDGEGAFSETTFSVTVVPVVTLPPNTIALWNFNGPVPDGIPGTGSLEPAGGPARAVAVIGGVTQTFSSVGGSATSDPEQFDNSMCRLSGFPPLDVGNKTAGLEFHASTEGYENITLRWDHYNSNTASRYWRIQYTIDGVEWVDHQVYEAGAPGRWRLAQTIGFGSVLAVNDNANFGVRLVAEFESTALDGGGDWYVAVNDGSNYSTAGTLWVDMIAITGEPLGATNEPPDDPVNTPPGISQIEDQTTMQDSATELVSFTIFDAETEPDNLVLSYTAERLEIVREVVFGGNGASRNAVVFPQEGASGESQITVRVTDEEGEFAEVTFTLTVLAPEEPPLPVSLAIRYRAGELEISWPATAVGYRLECATGLAVGDWEPAAVIPNLLGEDFVLSIRAEEAARFYRLGPE